MAATTGKDSVSFEDIQEAASVFLDVTRSAKILAQNKDKYLM